MSAGLQTSAKVGIEYDYLRTRVSRPSDPERRLMFEMLVDALRIYSGERRVGRDLLIETRAWLLEDNGEWFGYRNVCEVLGIDAVVLRAELPAWRGRRIESEYGAEGTLDFRTGYNKPMKILPVTRRGPELDRRFAANR